jgi:hypothetical protein
MSINSEFWTLYTRNPAVIRAMESMIDILVYFEYLLWIVKVSVLQRKRLSCTLEPKACGPRTPSWLTWYIFVIDIPRMDFSTFQKYFISGLRNYISECSDYVILYSGNTSMPSFRYLWSLCPKQSMRHWGMVSFRYIKTSLWWFSPGLACIILTKVVFCIQVSSL